MNLQLPSPIRDPPKILLRVECHDQNSRDCNNTFQNFNMVARGPNRQITREAFDDCLSWKRRDTPFIPFTSKWRRALDRRRRLLADGKRDVVIIAIWSKGLRGVYNAYEVAQDLGYRDGDGLDGRNRSQLTNHDDEYLVYGGISADEYRVLAIFRGQNELEGIPLRVPGLIGSTGESEQLFYLKKCMLEIFDCPFTSIQKLGLDFRRISDQ